MDLRSIINTDTSTNIKSSRDAQSYEPPGKASPVRSAPRGYESPSPGRGSYQARPVPPPLQPPVPNDFRSTSGSASFHSSQSPHLYNSPSSSLSGGPHPHPLQSPGYSSSYIQHPDATPTNEKPVPALSVGFLAQVTHGPPSVRSPITLESGHSFDQQYNAHAHPQTSPTLSSGRGPTPNTYLNSPTSTFQSQPYPHRPPYPPPLQSQPSTPIGPPPTYPQSTPAYRPEPTTTYLSPTGPASDPYGTFTREQSYPSMPQPSRADTRDSHSSDHRNSFQGVVVDEGQSRSEREYIAERKRERSLSVSPKTKVPSQQPRFDSAFAHADQWSGQVTPAKRKHDHEPEPESDPKSQLLTMPASQEPVNGARGSQPPTASQPSFSSHTSRRPYFDPIQSQEQEKDLVMLSPSEPPSIAPVANSRELSPANTKDHDASRSPSHIETHPQPSTPHSLSGRQSPTSGHSPNNAAPPSSHLSPPPQPIAAVNRQNSIPKQEPPIKSPVGADSSVSPNPPTKKRRRYDEPPIYARKAIRSTSNSPVVPNRRYPATGVGPTSTAPARHDSKQLKPLATQISDPPNVAKDANGVSASSEASVVALPQVQPDIQDGAPLSQWEPSITNLFPYEEVTRVIMDFLFHEVVDRKDVGPNTALQGAELEIEAKLGQLVDKNTNERIRLPILTECVIDKNNPNWRTVFKSSMTEAQHRVLNQFLNKAVLSSKQHVSPSPSQPHPTEAGTSSSKPRIPLDYVHTRERDRFYDLPQSQLPAIPLSVRPYINPRHRTRVRVTTDQKTGEKLAQIVKIRIADMDVYSPRTAFDWRLSINLEMTYDGDISSLTELVENGRRSERNKDRMTYKHLAYQIDLTQVTMQSDAGTTKAEREHELEIEVSAAKVREQGRLVKEGQANQYEDLIKGFVDNVRTLARVIPRPEGY
ncbi:MAG: mRNA-capping enzyme subunit beta [Peltula sp. TS41687]|nr:MAG: mRNA-capping enzyme subunit beta [Peltula sp. TS41687]